MNSTFGSGQAYGQEAGRGLGSSVPARSTPATITINRVQNGWVIGAGNSTNEIWVAKTHTELIALIEHLAEEHKQKEVEL